MPIRMENVTVDGREYIKAATGDMADWTYFSGGTTAEVINVLELARKQGWRVRLSYGDAQTGRDWLEEYDVEGTISRSMGPVKIPILLPNSRSTGGGGILTNCIVKVRLTGGDHAELYRHPQYHRPQMQAVPGDMAGYAATVLVGGRIHARFRTAKAAGRFIAKF